MRVRYRRLALHRTLRPTISLRFSSALLKNKTDDFHTPSGRWLWNHEISVSFFHVYFCVSIYSTVDKKIRYTPFNVEGLQNVACKVASAQRCCSMTKLGEGTPSLPHSKTPIILKRQQVHSTEFFYFSLTMAKNCWPAYLVLS